MWVKPQSEMSFLYGNNVTKGGLGRMTEGIPQYAGVVVYSMTDVPLGMWELGCLSSHAELCVKGKEEHNTARTRTVSPSTRSTPSHASIPPHTYDNRLRRGGAAHRVL